MPRRLICPDEGQVRLEEYALPASLNDDEILVRNLHGAEKHGTMQSFVKKHGNKRGAWDTERLMHTPGKGMVWPYPIPLGNMQVGTVEKIGSGVTRRKHGDRLVFFRGFEPYSVLQEDDGWVLKPDTDWKAAVCLDPASFAFTAIRDGNLRIGDAVAISGMGAIGLTAVNLARLCGAHPIIAIDPVEDRRNIAAALGAHLTVDPVTTEDVGAKIREATDWRGVDVVIEYSGAMQAMQSAFRAVAFGGTIVAGAFPGPWPAGLDLGGEAHMNRPNLIFSRTESDPNRDHPRWDNMRVRNTIQRMIVRNLIEGDKIVGPVVPFDEQLPATYNAVMNDPAKGAKLGVQYPQ